MPHRLHNVAVIVAVALLASACSWMPWAEKKKDPDAPADLTSYKAEVKIDRVWGGSIGEGLGKQYMHLSPGILADRIFAADGFGYVEARDRFRGKKLWRTRIGSDGKSTLSALNPFD